MIIANYKSKKDLTAAKGTKLDFTEDHPFASTYMSNGTVEVVGLGNKFSAQVTLVDDIITEVK